MPTATERPTNAVSLRGRRARPVSEVAERLREHAARRLTPEESAGALGMSMNTWRKYLAATGGRLVTDRTLSMPESEFRRE